MKQRLVGGLLIILMVLVGIPIIASAQSDIKARFKARLPVIKDLKSQGVIGEDNRGFLVFRTADRSQQAVVQAENQDRQTVYAAIARKEGTTVEFVGQRRSQQIAAAASPGEWLQNQAGTWFQK
jgi:uncharacterized protein YdbL (DUF1318 family)